MLFALRQPSTLLGLVLGFVVSMIALSGATRLLNRNSRFPEPFWHPRSWLDPYTAVAAVLGGIGWTPRTEVRRGFGRSQNRQLWTLALVSFLIPAALAAAGFAAYTAAVGGDRLPLVDSLTVLHMPKFGDLVVNAIAPGGLDKIALGFGVECLAIALMSLVPIPPLPTGVAVWTALPRKPQVRQVAYHLLEEPWGIGVVLVLLLVPLGGGETALLALISTVEDAVLSLF